MRMNSAPKVLREERAAASIFHVHLRCVAEFVLSLLVLSLSKCRRAPWPDGNPPIELGGFASGKNVRRHCWDRTPGPAAQERAGTPPTVTVLLWRSEWPYGASKN